MRIFKDSMATSSSAELKRNGIETSPKGIPHLKPRSNDGTTDETFKRAATCDLPAKHLELIHDYPDNRYPQIHNEVSDQSSDLQWARV